MADVETTAVAEPTEEKEKKKYPAWKVVLPIVIIAIVIVVAALFLTVLFVDDFHSIGDLFNYIGQQF